MIHSYLQIGNVPEAENLLAKLDSDDDQYAFYQGTIEIEKIAIMIEPKKYLPNF